MLLASRLWNFWEITWQITEGQDWLQRYLERAGYPAQDRPDNAGQPDVPPQVLADAHARLAWLQVLQNEETRPAIQHARASLALQPSGRSAALALITLGRASALDGSDLSAWMARAERAVAEARQTGDRFLLARASSLKGMTCMFMGRQAQAMASFNTAWQLFSELGERYISAEHRTFVSCLLMDVGDLPQARQVAEEAAAVAQERGGMWINSNLGWVTLAQADFAAAEAYFREYNAYWFERGHWELQEGLYGLALTALYQGHDSEARALLAQMLDIWNNKTLPAASRERWQYVFQHVFLENIYFLLGDTRAAQACLDPQLVNDGDYNTADRFRDRARLAVLEGDLPGAARDLASSLQSYLEFNRKVMLVEGLELAAELGQRTGRPELSARCLGAAQDFRRQHGLPLPPRFEPDIARLESRLCQALGRPVFEQNYAAGQAAGVENTAAETIAALG